MGSFSDVRDAHASMCVISRGVTCQGGPRDNPDRLTQAAKVLNLGRFSNGDDCVRNSAPLPWPPIPHDSSRNEAGGRFHLERSAVHVSVDEGSLDKDLSGNAGIEEW